jgi:hypothetical protein
MEETSPTEAIDERARCSREGVVANRMREEAATRQAREATTEKKAMTDFFLQHPLA